MTPSLYTTVTGNKCLLYTITYKSMPRVPKVLLLQSKMALLAEFKAEYQDCGFSVHTLLREVPANYVCMCTRDFERNACVMHTNFRHKTLHLFKHGALKDCLNSCRFLAAKSLCSSASFDPLAPLTWQESCATGQCQDCPGFTATCPEGKEGVVIALAQWQTKFCDIKQKKIHSLLSTNILLQDLVLKFDDELGKMTGHIYRAARIWETYKVS